jgi:hypothetical protein
VAETSWSVEFHPACEGWASDLSPVDKEALLAAIRILRHEGPNLGRPLVDSVVASRHSNMKELRPGSTGRSEIRVLFAFDVRRKAILLVGGDKSSNWSRWYRVNIPIADDRFDEHQATLRSKAAKNKSQKTTTRQPKGKRR